MSDVVCLMLDDGCRMFYGRPTFNLGFWFWICHLIPWVWDIECLMLDFRSRSSGLGLWMLSVGSWISDHGFWALELGPLVPYL